jgi:hypothetical protein
VKLFNGQSGDKGLGLLGQNQRQAVGLFWPLAILARNLLTDTPAEAVSWVVL